MTKSSSCVRSSHPPTPALAATHPITMENTNQKPAAGWAAGSQGL